MNKCTIDQTETVDSTKFPCAAAVNIHSKAKKQNNAVIQSSASILTLPAGGRVQAFMVLVVAGRFFL